MKTTNEISSDLIKSTSLENAALWSLDLRREILRPFAEFEDLKKLHEHYKEVIAEDHMRKKLVPRNKIKQASPEKRAEWSFLTLQGKNAISKYSENLRKLGRRLEAYCTSITVISDGKFTSQESWLFCVMNIESQFVLYTEPLI